MKEEKGQKSAWKERTVRSAKECAYLAVFVALVIAAQVVLSSVPGVEVVTVLFIAYAFVFGALRGAVAGIAFALLRQLVFPFSITVLILYLVYYPLLSLLFGAFGRVVKNPLLALWWLLPVAVLCTACFNLLDDLLTPLWYGMAGDAARAYFTASLPFMIPQLICTALSMAFLFLPLRKTFSLIKRRL